MFRWIVRTSLKFRFLVIFVTLAMMLYGIAEVRKMPVDVFPEFAPPLVEVQTEGLGMSTTEVEQLITIQLEEAFNGTPGLDVMRSKSVPGLSSIRLIFEPGTDQLAARQLVKERLAIAVPNLPSSVTPPYILQPLSATSRVMKIGLSSDEHSLQDLSMIAHWTIRMRLMEVPGVANVAIWGFRQKQMQVQVNPEKLQEYDLSMDRVMQVSSEALEFSLLKYSASAKTLTGGWIDTPNQRLGIRHILPATTPEELAKVTFNEKTKADGTPLLLGDVGDVLWDYKPLIGDAVINDGPGLLLIVEKFPWGNSLDVTRGVEQALEAMKPGLPGIEIDSTIFRPATFIEMVIQNLSESLLFGSILVVIILFAFLFEWRVALISLVIIPVSLMSALLVLNVQGATINVMVLAGLVIAIGAVVDDAIVDVENIVRRLRQLRAQGDNKPIASIVLDASLEVRGAIVYASLIEISALLPVFFLEGLSGSFFRPLAGAYVVAGLVSPLVALTVTPALILIFLSNAPDEHRESPLIRWLRKGYSWMLEWVIRTPRIAYVTVLVIALAGLSVLPFLGQELLPSFKETDFLMHWLTKPGTSHPEMYRITADASRELRAIPGVRNFGAHIGRAVSADEVVGMYFTENWVSIEPDVDYDKTVAAIQDTVDGYPGLVRDVQTYLKERIREVLTGASEAVVVRIYGPELNVLRAKAEEVRAQMEEIEGVKDLHVALQVDIPEIQIKVDLEKAQAYGVKPGDVLRSASAMLAGTEVSDIYKDNKIFDLVVWSQPEARQSLTDVRNLLIDLPDGGHVRLDEIADVYIAPTPNVIERENNARFISVVANVHGRDLGSFVADVENRLAKVPFPLEYHPEVLGEFAERQQAQQRILIAGLAAVLAIFFLLVTSFESWRLAILSFFTLPWALVGGVLAAFMASKGVISLGSLVGFLTILGIAARNGIMLISHYQHLETEEGMTFGQELVLRGSRERVAPIMMTALTTGLALVPLVIAGNIPGHEIEHPMAIVILGGLVTSTLLNLFVVPSLYLRFGKPNATSTVVPEGPAIPG